MCIGGVKGCIQHYIVYNFTIKLMLELAFEKHTVKRVALFFFESGSKTLTQNRTILYTNSEFQMSKVNQQRHNVSTNHTLNLRGRQALSTS